MSFSAPLILAALLALPLLVWLLRAIPPRPERQVFGGMYFLRKLSTPKQQPVRTPPIILIVRLLAFAAIVIGLAGPKLGPQTDQTSGPMTLVFGDGWDAAQRWEERLDAARAAIAATDGEIRILTASNGELSPPLSPTAAARAFARLNPQPKLADWLAIREALAEVDTRIVLVPGGLSPDDEIGVGSLPPVTAYLPEGQTLALGAPRVTSDSIAVSLYRSRVDQASSHRVRALSRDGRTVSVTDVTFAPGEDTAEALFRLPLALRNEVSRLDVEGIRSAGATSLLGSSARRTLAGLVSTGSGTLREGGFYISKALEPSAEIIEAPIRELTNFDPGLIILDDVGTLRSDDRIALQSFLQDGGILVRFAGPDLLAGDSRSGDPLLPAPILGGERALGGALTWAEPQRVASINQDSPLGGLTLSEEIAVRRQVLTQPGADAEVWASLADGTPLITAARRGDGLVVLIHVSAAPTWSDLPVSGFFAALMQRLAALAETDIAADVNAAGEPLPARKLLSGRGALTDPPGDAAPLVPGEPLPSPGLYGDGANERAVNAYRLSQAPTAFTADLLPRGSRVLTVEDGPQRDLSPYFLAAALVLLMIDAIISLGRLPFFRAAAAGLALFVAVAPLSDASAQLRPPLPRKAVEAALELRFAYIRTGDPATDRLSEAGLRGLTAKAAERSSLEPAAPQAVDPDRDELSVYTLLYWPVRPGQEPPSDAALQRLEAYMASGGMLIIDTGDGGAPGRGGFLGSVLGRLDAPPLEPLPDDHVLLFSFYRLDDLWGRNATGRVWVETRGALDQRRDGVPSLIIAGRDWASAWALDAQGIPLKPPGPGGEGRREMAFRAGINMAMVAITGNYKADQADVEAMLDKLGEEAGGL
ncbi:DUF4159 domain-containing protein [Parvularcula lutaonensis]|uniref:DUF4159 domain-containing protein n=1 Tax=Parvularcula lutaonensis TaxID=491923 RepID=A0ABV7M9F0_9PROT|nr:DUF4159 domain-containing protein [Parvularcula lutaonensis]GGY42187.1 RNA-binding protein [Parvularcula lutaonensis]